MVAKRALVVGATSGIGMEVAKALAAAGWTVGIAGRREDRLRAVAGVIGGGCAAYRRIDVDLPDAPRLLEELIMEMGGMDLYFHCSGIGFQNRLLDPAKELATVETNAVGFARMVGAAFRYFADKGGGGRIAAVSSIAGTKGLGAAAAYSATKRFQNTYLESLDQLSRSRGLGIRVTDIRPGFVATDLIKGGGYPMQMDAARVAAKIVRAVEGGKPVKVIDWRYRLLTLLWGLCPRALWVRLRV